MGVEHHDAYYTLGIAGDLRKRRPVKSYAEGRVDELKLSTRVLLVSAVVLLIVLITGPFGYKFGVVPLLPSLASLLLAVAGGALVILVGIFYLVGAIRSGSGSDRNVLAATMILSALPIVIMVPQILAAQAVPPIHDITTDLDNPPAFVQLLTAREAAPNGAEYGASEAWPADKLREAQTGAYPDIQPINSSLDKAGAVSRAEQVLTEMGLEIAGVDAAAGLVEATATTFWFGFKDDMVVRVMETAEGSRIDIRSMSRVGQSDVGANAARIADFISRF